MTFEEKIARQIKKYGLLFPGEKLVAAVSGGPDSVAMLYALRQITRDWPVTIHVAHLNHRLRGQASSAEADFVVRLAKSSGLAWSVESIDVAAFRREKGCSLEDAARQVRYAFLRRVASEVNADGILTAHHADDQAETVLLHLIRGSGAEGLAAIAPREGDLRRPCLAVGKAEIIDYCRANGLDYCLDASNGQTDFLRNRIRLQLMPELRGYNPQFVSALVKTAEICRGENQLLDHLCEQAMTGISLTEDPAAVSFSRSALLGLPIALQRRVLRRLYDRLAGTHGGLDFDQTERVLALATGKELALPGGVRACRDYNSLSLQCSGRTDGQMAGGMDNAAVMLTVPGRTEIKALGIAVEIMIKPFFRADSPSPVLQGVFRRTILGEPLSIRTRRPGDCFQPAGLAGRKKLKNYFIDEKISRRERDRIPLLLTGSRIIWVVGKRFAAEHLADENDREIVLVTVEKLSPE